MRQLDESNRKGAKWQKMEGRGLPAGRGPRNFNRPEMRASCGFCTSLGFGIRRFRANCDLLADAHAYARKEKVAHTSHQRKNRTSIPMA